MTVILYLLLYSLNRFVKKLLFLSNTPPEYSFTHQSQNDTVISPKSFSLYIEKSNESFTLDD